MRLLDTPGNIPVLAPLIEAASIVTLFA
ncbi:MULTISPECIES: hypothetical protein [Burkholderiaceae]